MLHNELRREPPKKKQKAFKEKSPKAKKKPSNKCPVCDNKVVKEGKVTFCPVCDYHYYID